MFADRDEVDVPNRHYVIAAVHDVRQTYDLDLAAGEELLPGVSDSSWGLRETDTIGILTEGDKCEPNRVLELLPVNHARIVPKLS